MDKQVKETIQVIMENTEYALNDEELEVEENVIDSIKTVQFLTRFLGEYEEEDYRKFMEELNNDICDIIDTITELHRKKLKSIFRIG